MLFLIWAQEKKTSLSIMFWRWDDNTLAIAQQRVSLKIDFAALAHSEKPIPHRCIQAQAKRPLEIG